MISRWSVQFRFTRHPYGRFGLLLGCSGLGTLGSVLRAALGAVFHTACIQSTAYDMVTHTGKVLSIVVPVTLKEESTTISDVITSSTSDEPIVVESSLHEEKTRSEPRAVIMSGRFIVS